MEVNTHNVDLLRAPLILDLDDTDPHSYKSFIDKFRLRVSIVIENMRVFHPRDDYLILRVKSSDDVDVELYIDMFTSYFEGFRVFGEKNWIEFKRQKEELTFGSRKAGFDSGYGDFGVDLREVRVGRDVLVEGVIYLKKVAEALESGGTVTTTMKLGIGELCFNIMEGMRFHAVCRWVVDAYLMPISIDGTIAHQWKIFSGEFWADLMQRKSVVRHFEVLAVCLKYKFKADKKEFKKNMPKIK